MSVSARYPFVPSGGHPAWHDWSPTMINERGEDTDHDPNATGDIPPSLSSAVLQAVLDLSDDAIVVCGSSGLVGSWSPTATRLVGYGEQGVVGTPLQSLFPEHLRTELDGVLRRALAGERVRRFESEVTRVDGMPVPVWMSVSAASDPDAGVKYLVVILRDLTEQRLDQAALGEIEGRLQDGEALAHVGSWLWDVRTGAVQWSAEFYRIHQVDPRHFRGNIGSFLEAVHPEDRERVVAAFESSVRDSRPLETDYRPATPSGTTRVIRVRAQPTVGSSGQVVGLRGVGQDVTDLA